MLTQTPSAQVALGTNTIDRTHHTFTNPLAGFFCPVGLFDSADEFMTQNTGKPHITPANLQIRGTNPHPMRLDDNFTLGRLWFFKVVYRLNLLAIID